jgi:hypothetical protein
MAILIPQLQFVPAHRSLVPEDFQDEKEIERITSEPMAAGSRAICDEIFIAMPDCHPVRFFNLRLISKDVTP